MTSERRGAQTARSTRHRTDSRVRPSDVADEQGNVSDFFVQNILIASFKMWHFWHLVKTSDASRDVKTPIDWLWKFEKFEKDSVSTTSEGVEKKFNNAQTATAAGGSAINTSLFVQNAMQVCWKKLQLVRLEHATLNTLDNLWIWVKLGWGHLPSEAKASKPCIYKLKNCIN